MSSVATTMVPNDTKGLSIPTFDAEKDLPRSSHFRTWIVFTAFPKGFWLLRKVWPIACLAGYRIVTRYDDVAEVLSRHDVFRVPFDAEMARLNDGKEPGTPFILGIDNTQAHDEQLMKVMRIFKRSDVKAIVEPVSFNFAETAIKSSGKASIEAIGELITGVPLHLCGTYYGIDVAGDPRTFAYATIMVSQQLFGPLPITPKSEVDNAADYVRSVVERSIDKEIGNPSGKDTIVSRLIESYRKPVADAGHLPRDQVRAFLMGMIVGFVPTNTIAGGHILEMLLRREDFRKQARAAALSGDDDLLKHCLFEAMRFMPLNPGPFRICEKDHTLAAGTPRAKKIRKGQQVMASAMSAMMDADKVDRPYDFVPGRPASDYMLFGYGIHWCAGVFIAQSQITQTFKALLQQPKLERGSGEDRWPRYRGLVPDYQVVRFL